MTTRDLAPPLAPGRLPMDPRIRHRRALVRRAEGRRRLHVVMAMAAVVLVAGAGVGVLYSPLLQVDTVSVTGATHTRAADVLRAGGLDARPQMINVQPARVAARLAALPWVASARVTRRWPSTIHVSLVERSVVAQIPVESPAGEAPAPGGGRVALLDATGRVLTLGAEPVANLPVLVGESTPAAPGTSIDAVAGANGEPSANAEVPVFSSSNPGGAHIQLSPALVSSELAVVAALPPDVRARVATIGVGPDGSLQATASIPQLTVIFGSGDDLAAKVAALQTVLARVPMGGPETLDLRVPNRPALTGSSVAH